MSQLVLLYYTKSESDGKYLLNTTDTFTGELTVKSNYNQGVNFYNSSNSSLSTHLHIGDSSTGTSIIMGNKRYKQGSIASPINEYAAYIAYDAYYDDSTTKWKAKRTSLDRKFKIEMGYHNADITFDYATGDMTDDITWTQLFRINSTGNIFAKDEFYANNSNLVYHAGNSNKSDVDWTANRLFLGDTVNAKYIQGITNGVNKYLIGSKANIDAGNDDDLGLYSYLGNIYFWVEGYSAIPDFKITVNNAEIGGNTVYHAGNSNLSTVDWTAKTLFADTFFSSIDSAAVLSTASAGNVYLRPISSTSTTGQFVVGTTQITANNPLVVNSYINATTGKFSTLSDGYMPYHVNDSTGLANSPIYTNGTNVGINLTTFDSGTGYLQIENNTGKFGILMSDNGVRRSGLYNHATYGGELYLYYGTTPTLGIKLSSSGDSYFNGGNVGIGTSSPTAKIDVIGESHYTSSGTGNAEIVQSLYALQIGTNAIRSSTVNDYLGGIAFSQLLKHGSDSGTYDIAPQAWIGTKMVSTAGSELASLIFATKSGLGYTGTGNDIPVERMIILPTGEVGIGTSSPSTLLTVQKSTAGDIAYFRSTGGTNNPILYIEGSETGTGEIIFRQSGTNYGDFVFKTSNIERFRIDNNGNVGIGTDSPDNELEVHTTLANGGIKINGTSNGTNLIINTQNTGNNYYNGIFFKGWTGTAEKELARIVAYQSTNAATGHLRFYTSDGTSTERMRILSNGKVGIGTTNPLYTLDVSGDGRFTSSLIAASGNFTNLTSGYVPYDNGTSLVDSIYKQTTIASGNYTAEIGLGSSNYLEFKRPGGEDINIILHSSTLNEGYLNFYSNGDTNGPVNQGGWKFYSNEGDSLLHLDSGGLYVEAYKLRIESVPLDTGSLPALVWDSSSRQVKYRTITGSGTGVSTFLELTDTISAYTSGNILIQGVSTVTDDDNFYYTNNELRLGSSKLALQGSGDTLTIYNGSTNKSIEIKTIFSSTFGSIKITPNTTQTTTFNTDGTVSFPNNASFGSDRRLKYDIQKYNITDEDYMRLKPVYFKWQENHRYDIGFIAQEFKLIENRLVDDRDPDHLRILYNGITAINTSKIQEILSGNKERDRRIELLEQEVMELREEIRTLKSA